VAKTPQGDALKTLRDIGGVSAMLVQRARGHPPAVRLRLAFDCSQLRHRRGGRQLDAIQASAKRATFEPADGAS
jgi:hypothetical protein